MEKVEKLLLIGAILISFLLVLGIVVAKDLKPFHQIKEDKIEVDTPQIYASATPHTLKGSGWVVFNFTSKEFNGLGDIGLGFSSPDLVPKEIQIYSPSKKGNWSSLNNVFEKENYDVEGLNEWFFNKGVPIIKDREYVYRIYIENKNIFDLEEKEYWFVFKPTNDNVKIASIKETLYSLDPWTVGVKPDAYLRFESDGRDYTNNGNNASNCILGYGCDYRAGKLGNAIYIPNGTANYITIVKNASLLFGTNDFTIVFWYNATAVDGNTAVASGGNLLGGWGLTNSDTLRFVTNNIGSDVAGVGIANGQWRRVVFSRTGINLTLYVDNVTIASRNISDNLNLQGTINIGTLNIVSEWDDFALYTDYAWTTVDVEEDWNGGAGAIQGYFNAPNVTIVEPNSTFTGYVFNIRINSTSEVGFDNCYYNVTDSAYSLEISNTVVACGDLADNDLLSSNGAYIFNYYSEDVYGSVNISSSNFTIASTDPPPASTGGGGTAFIDPTDIVSTGTDVCQPFETSWIEMLAEIRTETFYNKVKFGWSAFWDYFLCKSASAIVPI